MDYEIVERIDINKKRCKKVGAFLYDPEIDGLYHESPWWFPVQIGVTHGLTKCQVTPMFLKLPFIMKGWINHDILLRQIELLRLAQKDNILMHGSCVGDTLIVGFPNSGKTYETYRRVAKGQKLISEEYTILSCLADGSWWASPYKTVMRTCFSKRTLDDCGMKISFKERMRLWANTLRAKLFPFMHEAVIWKEMLACGDSREVNKIELGSTGEAVTDWKTFAILCENEFPFMSSEFLQAYAVVTGYDIIGIQEKQRKLIKEFVDAVYSDSKL